jgi:hypothetical protein
MNACPDCGCIPCICREIETVETNGKKTHRLAGAVYGLAWVIAIVAGVIAVAALIAWGCM